MRMAVVVAALLVLPGCYSIGSRSIADQSRLEQLVSGMSTKADVLTLLGQPTMSFSDGAGMDLWAYQYTQARANPAQFIPFVGLFVPPEVESKTLTLHFNSDGVLERIARSHLQSGLDKSPPAAPSSTKGTQIAGKRLGGAAS
jgi:outer membrane protein assembly factor BamE (lipoprotein component of BamABCDE complex)